MQINRPHDTLVRAVTQGSDGPFVAGLNPTVGRGYRPRWLSGGAPVPDREVASSSPDRTNHVISKMLR
jgi:hypothetical protein